MELPLTPSDGAQRKPRMPPPLRPPREHARRPLAARLLVARAPGGSAEPHDGRDEAAGLVGPAHVRASDLERVVAGETGAPVFATFDVPPEQLSAQPPVPVVRYLLDVSADELDEALELDAPGPVAMRVRGGGGGGGITVRECAERAVAAGRSLVLPAGAGAGDVADFQSSFVHSDAGYLAEADDAAGVVRVLACAVAGISGGDVRAAFDRPDVDYLLSLSDMAADAVRELLLGVLVPDPRAVAEELAALGFGAQGAAEAVPDWYS
ncbi:hypothetical protein [Tomitella gaofuii]|uniref:hypothetical protein n=1 Tax=Tomitella gaofuii TaxID=2760083 RepID=UPI0015FDA5DF|nr:hypothetical protein [Tomitella gaofuii]